MNEGKFNFNNSRLKRSNCNADKISSDEPSSKSQRLLDDQCYQKPVNDSQFENSEITEHNYKKISATTILKKLQVLETRDKIERSIVTQPIKEVSVEEIKPMEGTCYDMCPEKERLLRIHGNMVSQFECKMVDSKLEPDIEIMVKQYARSSADQANPLSCELRPTSVLVKTMSYMLKNIIRPIEYDVEQDLASWYDFCWDRLRAIRKDIVQQNLRNPEVVTILEQIGRFHIACYDLMLGYTGFDIKLNTENLNNCIQMLTPMYRNSEQPCVNEPEFVSYELLMYLGNPQFYTAYDLLPVHIKQSAQVRFCIEAHTTYLQSSNTVDFFDLLNNTTYMNCCILQRVIPSIRYYNITMMNMSYTTAKRVYKIEMKHFMKKLCFDDVDLAQEFCADIQLKYDNAVVDLSRKISLSAPENRRRKQELVIVRKRRNLTYLIAGTDTLPDVVIDPVHSSFDGDNCFNDPAAASVDEPNEAESLNNGTSEDELRTMDAYSFPDPKDVRSSFVDHQPLSIAEQPPIFDSVPKFTFTLPTHFQFPRFDFQTPPTPPVVVVAAANRRHDDSASERSNQPAAVVPNNNTAKPSAIHDPSPSAVRARTSQKSAGVLDADERARWTELADGLAKKYLAVWQRYVARKKSKRVEEAFAAHDEWFHSECISSLSSSPSSARSTKDDDGGGGADTDVLDTSNDKWLERQYLLAQKYFYVWLRNILRRRRKIEIVPVSSMPWAIYMQVHGTPAETLNRNIELAGKKGPPTAPPFWNRRPVGDDDDISAKIADVFVRNVLETATAAVVDKNVFWKLAVNYGDWSESRCLRDKVRAVIYGNLGYGDKAVQRVRTEHGGGVCLVKSVESDVGPRDWTGSGMNAALVYTNTNAEGMESLFGRVGLMLDSTPAAVPVVLVFSSGSDAGQMGAYRSVLDAYRENGYVNAYRVCVWDGPKTVLDAVEFFSAHYADVTPGMRSETLYYNLLSFAQAFYLYARKRLPAADPTAIVDAYNRCLHGYVQRLGKRNAALRHCAPEFAPYHARDPDEFAADRSNMNAERFEATVNGAYLPPYGKPWPPDNVDDVIDYVKAVCRLTNRRCWCLDILQMLRLRRDGDPRDCLSGGDWHGAIEIWVQGALEKCTATEDRFTVLYSGRPIDDVMKIVFPDQR